MLRAFWSDDGALAEAAGCRGGGELGGSAGAGGNGHLRERASVRSLCLADDRFTCQPQQTTGTGVAARARARDGARGGGAAAAAAARACRVRAAAAAACRRAQPACGRGTTSSPRSTRSRRCGAGVRAAAALSNSGLGQPTLLLLVLLLLLCCCSWATSLLTRSPAARVPAATRSAGAGAPPRGGRRPPRRHCAAARAAAAAAGGLGPHSGAVCAAAPARAAGDGGCEGGGWVGGWGWRGGMWRGCCGLLAGLPRLGHSAHVASCSGAPPDLLCARLRHPAGAPQCPCRRRCWTRCARAGGSRTLRPWRPARTGRSAGGQEQQRGGVARFTAGRVAAEGRWQVAARCTSEQGVAVPCSAACVGLACQPPPCSLPTSLPLRSIPAVDWAALLASRAASSAGASSSGGSGGGGGFQAALINPGWECEGRGDAAVQVSWPSRRRLLLVPCARLQLPCVQARHRPPPGPALRPTRPPARAAAGQAAHAPPGAARLCVRVCRQAARAGAVPAGAARRGRATHAQPARLHPAGQHRAARARVLGWSLL